MALFIREHWSLYLVESLVLVALDASCRAYHADLSSEDFDARRWGVAPEIYGAVPRFQE